MALGTEWPPSSSDGGHNRYPTDIGGNSGILRSKCGGRLCSCSARGRASTALAPKVSGGVELSREFSCFVLVFQEAKMEEDIFWRCGVNRQPAEAIDMGLGSPRPMLDWEVVLLQRCWPAVEECRPCPHRFEPLQAVVVRVHLKWHSHEVGTKLGNGPNDGETFQFGSGVSLLSLIEWPGSAADDALPALADLWQYCAKACSWRVRI